MPDHAVGTRAESLSARKELLDAAPSSAGSGASFPG
jgi:hypothetical protein